MGTTVFLDLDAGRLYLRQVDAVRERANIDMVRTVDDLAVSGGFAFYADDGFHDYLGRHQEVAAWGLPRDGVSIVALKVIRAKDQVQVANQAFTLN